MRRDHLCPTPEQCPEALTPEVQASLQDLLPCEECPEQKLALFLESQAGRQYSTIFDLDFALQSRIQVPMDRINYLEFILLRILADEREKFNAEEHEKLRSKPHGS
jgi:hypothetical protein